MNSQVVAKGYKQTKVGVIPEDWDVVKLGKILTIGSGKDYKHLKNGDIPVYGTGGYMLSVNKFLFDGESLCIGRKGTIDKPMLLNGKFWTVDTLFYTHSYINSIPKFLYSSFLRINWKKYNEASGVPSLSKSTIETITISLPPLNEQEKIANILITWDDAISKQTELIKAKEELKKGLMQKLLSGEVRFGRFFDEWEIKKVNDLFVITRGSVLAVTNMKDIATDEYKYSVFSSQTKNNGVTGYYNKYLFENCITWTTDGANAGDVNLREGKFYCTNVCGVLKSNNGYANKCIAYILNLVTRKYVSYVGNPKLMNNTMGIIKIKIPKSLEEQQKIAEVLNNADKEIDLLKNELEELKEQKKGLMQKLLTGIVRVKV